MKVALAHYRVGLTDGVSLEIDKRKALLEQLGHETVTIAGTHSGDIDLYIPYFEYKTNPTIENIRKLCFLVDKEEELRGEIKKVVDEISMQLESFYEREKFDVLFMFNLFALSTCLPGSIAFAEFLRRHPEVKGVVTHHDFYWEAPRAHHFAFTNPYAQEILAEYFAPKLPNLWHSCINSMAQGELKKRRDIDSNVMTDTFDFDQPLWEKNDRNREFLADVGLKKNDIVFLIAVRVRERKAVELAIDALESVASMKKNFVGVKKYNGEEITEDSRVVLLVPGEYTYKEKMYIKLLKEKAKELNVEVLWISDIVGSEEEQRMGTKKYALWDCYVYSDIVMYTSHWEGWGNQFIEAVFAKKPLLVFEYPVFITDIRTADFTYVSLGDKYTVGENNLVHVEPEKLANSAVILWEILTIPQKYNEIVEHNFKNGKAKYNTNQQLLNYLKTYVVN